jgi:hypothetical protein
LTRPQSAVGVTPAPDLGDPLLVSHLVASPADPLSIMPDHYGGRQACVRAAYLLGFNRIWELGLVDDAGPSPNYPKRFNRREAFSPHLRFPTLHPSHYAPARPNSKAPASPRIRRQLRTPTPT